jgi:hypothetical protein
MEGTLRGKEAFVSTLQESSTRNSATLGGMCAHAAEEARCEASGRMVQRR